MFPRSLLATAAAILTLGTPTWAQDTRTYTDALDRSVEIPVEPQRIVAMADHVLALPLVELDANLVGSVNRVDSNGEIFFRSVRDVFPGWLIQNELAPLGNSGSPDFEAMAALRPDLIIARTWDEENLPQLEAVAPVVVLSDLQEPLKYYRDIADVSGRLNFFETMLDRYDGQIAQARDWLGAHDHTYQMPQFEPGDGTLYVCGRYGGLTRVLDDLGFEMVGISAEVRESGDFCSETSAERFQELDADWLFDTYRLSVPGVIDQQAEINGIFPGGCEVLSACREGRMAVLPRAFAFPTTFTTMDMMMHHVVSPVAGRPGIVAPDWRHFLGRHERSSVPIVSSNMFYTRTSRATASAAAS
ncbi:MAG: ABC transporter substrate-binding protein [Shimia sp.]